MLAVSVGAAVLVWATPLPTTVDDFFMPGSQPGQSGLFAPPDNCVCHAQYNPAVEPLFTWGGSMMAQAARDPLFYACLTIANQDAAGSGELCIRCHSPGGWLEEHSQPPDASALTFNDRAGVQCNVCHRMVKPTPVATNPYPGDSLYTADTYPLDQVYLGMIDSIPTHSANGMFVIDLNDTRRGGLPNPAAPHPFVYAPFQREADLCGTCHNVSNPVFSKDSNGAYVNNGLGQPAPDFDPFTMFPIERTFSEWSKSEYASTGVHAPQFGGNKDTVRTCQDCHMHDVTGKNCRQANAPVRDDMPLHDLTGGNAFVPLLISTFFPGEVDVPVLEAGVTRAIAMLQKAATLTLTVMPDTSGHLATVRVTNETGHKLPSGYPEGRRMWLQVVATDSSDSVVYVSGDYDTATAVLTLDSDIKVYETTLGISDHLAPSVDPPAGPSFHFVLNDSIYKDNRIPPRGFANAAFDSIQASPVAYSYADGQYWDDTEYLIPDDAVHVTVTLSYQTASREYIEFLRDENMTNDWGQDLYDAWAANGKSMPVTMASVDFSLDCHCPCHADPACDGIADVFDVVAAVDVAFRSVPPTFGNYCPHEQTDVNCDGITDVFDVIDIVDVAFRGSDPLITFCDPCSL